MKRKVGNMLVEIMWRRLTKKKRMFFQLDLRNDERLKCFLIDRLNKLDRGIKLVRHVDLLK